MKAAWLLACSIASARALAFDARIASKTIKSGGIYVLDDWLEPRLARALRDDALALQEAGAFSKSGVSNTAAAASRYGAQDRAVRTLGPSVGGDVQARAELDGLLEGLRAALSERSPGPLTLEEQYYSIHAPGAFLGRHMDERHEACKGEAGFLHDSRRSVSWLVYLQQAKRGGELRAWCRESAGDVGAHEGDVQVGWLPRNRPVFLDAYVRDGDDARYGLYVVDGRERRYVSEPFSGASPAWIAACGGRAELDADAFHAALGAMTPEAGYRSVECVDDPDQYVVDVATRAGTLVLFDTVASPHEVLPTEAGARVAAAGWFHEPAQEPPDWY